MADESLNYQAIKALMQATPPKPMLAKYDRDGDGTDPQGSRKMWPMVLGHSPDPDNPDDEQEMVLCFQTTGSPTQRGWRCMKVALLSNISATTPSQPRPALTEAQVARQSCVANVELSLCSTRGLMSMSTNTDHYQDIYTAIVNGYPIAAKYKGKDRKLWPIVLGTSPKPGSSGQTKQMLLGWEFELNNQASNPPVWRCYEVKLFTGSIQSTAGPNKPVLTQAEIDRQSCVVTPDPSIPLP